MVTDTVLGAMFIAGRSCGPPNALSSSTLAAIEQKYIESVCYYAGPIFRSITDNNTVEVPCYNSTFEKDIVLVSISATSSARLKARLTLYRQIWREEAQQNVTVAWASRNLALKKALCTCK